MECRFYDDGEADDNEKDGENGFPGDVVRKDILSGEEKNDASGEKAEAHEFFFFGEETDYARDDDKQGPPAVEEDAEIK